MSEAKRPDELRYDLPQNILLYEQRFWGGLTLPEMFAGVFPFMGGIMLIQGVGGMIAGAIGALLGFLAMKKFERFGGRSLVGYLIARWLHRRRKPSIKMRRIFPAGHGQVIILGEDGETKMEIGGKT